jgi:hypothetical protein
LIDVYKVSLNLRVLAVVAGAHAAQSDGPAEAKAAAARAVKLYEAGSALIDYLPADESPFKVHFQTSALDAARRLLSPQEFDEARLEGTKLTEEEACTLALAQ